MTRRMLYRLVLAVAVCGAIAYLFSLFPNPSTPDFVYEWTPVLLVAVAWLVVEMVLLKRQSASDRLRKRKVWDEAGNRVWLAQTPRRIVGFGLGFAGYLLAFNAVEMPMVGRTVAGLAFLETTRTLAAASLFCSGHLMWAPWRMSRALFVLGSLLIVTAGVAPLVVSDGSEWLSRGFHLSYFLVGSAVLTLASGVVAVTESHHMDEAPDLYAREESAG